MDQTTRDDALLDTAAITNRRIRVMQTQLDRLEFLFAATLVGVVAHFLKGARP